MKNCASFRFYFSLNDFLAVAEKGQEVLYYFNRSPSVKDAIETLGIPHPEVDAILVNGTAVGFDYLLQAEDKVAVYPATNDGLKPTNHSIQAALPASDSFILDVHLGKLARALRLLGFDTTYQNDYADATIAQLADHENKIVLTRDIGLLKHRRIQRGYWLRSQHLEEQLEEVISYFRLQPKFKPFTRCMVCNSTIKAVSKEEVQEQLPPRTKQFFEEFYQCPACKRVYWKGSHYERMQAFVQRLAQK